FQHGRWTFAHNGDIPDFPLYRERLLQRVDERLSRFILGDTDSEVIFFLLLSELQRHGPLRHGYEVGTLVDAVRSTARQVREVCDRSPGDRSLLTMVVTDGQSLAAMHGGKELFFSTHKRRCPERHTCSSLSSE